MAADNAAAWPRDAEIPLTDVRSVPKTGLARPPPTQQTARKGRLNFLYAAEAVLTLTIVFGAYSFADGVLGLWSGYKNMRQGESWGWLIFSGLLGIATGLIVLVSPFVATLVLTVFLWTMVAFWSITSGVMEIVAAFRLRKEIEGEWLLVLSGVISILLGAAVTWVLFTTPAGSVLALGWLLGVYAAIFGVTMILLALKLRKVSASDDTARAETTAT